MKPEQERVKNLLQDTVTLLCRNGLSFQDELKVEGLIGITLDNHEVFLVHLNEKFGPGGVLITGESAAEEKQETTKPTKSEPSKSSSSRHHSNSESYSGSSSRGGSASSKLSSDVVIKVENDPDMFKQEMKSACALDGSSSNSRVPPLHGTDDGPPRSPAGFPGNMSHKRSSEKEHGSSKRRRGSENAGISVPYITGMVGNIHTQQSPNASNSSWASSGLPPDFASQVADGQVSMDSMQAANWMAAANNPSPGTSQMMGAGDQMRAAGGDPDQVLLMTSLFNYRQRRPRIDSMKEYGCPVEGCGKRFYHARNLRHHQKEKHGEQKGRISAAPAPRQPSLSDTGNEDSRSQDAAGIKEEDDSDTKEGIL